MFCIGGHRNEPRYPTKRQVESPGCLDWKENSGLRSLTDTQQSSSLSFFKLCWH